MKIKNHFLATLLLPSILSSCIGPEYEKPKIAFTDQYKYDGIIWQQAQPSADMDRGQWWKIYNDPILNGLIDKLNNNNQDIASAAASYKQSLAIVNEARAAYFPTVNSTYADTSQKTNQPSNDTSNHSLNINSSWEIDLWGSTRYTVASDFAAALSSKAYLALTQLSAQSSLAQYYYEIRGLDINQKYLNSIVLANKKMLEYANNRYNSGVDDHLAVLNAKINLENAISNAENNKINRNQYQIAIAILIGEAPSSFSLAPLLGANDNIFALTPVPISIPSELLQRRPDIAQAEQLLIQANAQIGVARAAFFPSLQIAASVTMQGNGNTMGQLLSMPNMIWSVGPQLAFNILDGGLRRAQTSAAWAGYEENVALYRQTVLTAFADVENQLVAVKIYNEQAKMLNKAAKQNKELLKLTTNQYKAGTVDYSQILTAQINYYNAAISACSNESLRRSAEILLIKAIGGGWKESDLEPLTTKK